MVLCKRWVGLEGWRRRVLADGHVICELVISPCCIKPVFSWMSAVELQAAFIPARLWDLVRGWVRGKSEFFFVCSNSMLTLTKWQEHRLNLMVSLDESRMCARLNASTFRYNIMGFLFFCPVFFFFFGYIFSFTWSVQALKYQSAKGAFQKFRHFSVLCTSMHASEIMISSLL